MNYHKWFQFGYTNYIQHSNSNFHEQLMNYTNSSRLFVHRDAIHLFFFKKKIHTQYVFNWKKQNKRKSNFHNWIHCSLLLNKFVQLNIVRLDNLYLSIFFFFFFFFFFVILFDKLDFRWYFHHTTLRFCIKVIICSNWRIIKNWTIPMINLKISIDIWINISYQIIFLKSTGFLNLTNFQVELESSHLTSFH